MPSKSTAGPSSSAQPTLQQKKSYKKAQPPSSDSDSGSETDSSEDVTEDEDGVDLTPALDAAILRTLAKIRNKKGVYEGEEVLANELKEAEEKVIKAGIKAMPNRREEIKKYTLADHHRAALLNGEANVKEEEDDTEPLTHVESQYKLRNEAVSAFKALAEDSNSDDDADEGGLLQKREKQDVELDEDDEEYRRFLLEMGGGEEEVRKLLGMGDQPVQKAQISDDEEEVSTVPAVMQPKKLTKRAIKKKERKAKEDDDFLMNYILGRGWIDRTEEHVPTYEEITGRSREDKEAEAETAIKEEESQAGPSHPWGALEDEDDFDEKAEEFETAYNFRFEEPGATEILTHPREIPSLVRRTDDTRALKRAAKAERKAAEKQAKEEEARRQKGEKRREMEKQMASLRKDLGYEDGQGEVDWEELEKVMEGDFDEGEWERVVGKMLGSRDYNEDDEEDDGEKPEWDDDVHEATFDDVDDEDVEMHMTFGEGAGAGAGTGDDEDGPINMDADFEAEEPKKKNRRKNKKGKNKAESREEETGAGAGAGAADENEGLTVKEKAKKVKKAMEEYNALDHEDMIGDMPTRFKYVQSKPSAFGLTPTEILLATDKELDSIAGLRFIAPYRKQGLGMQGRGISKRIYDLKQKLKTRKWGEEPSENKTGGGGEEDRSRDSGWGGKRKAEDGDGEGPSKAKKKRLGKKQRYKEKAAAGAGASQAPQAGDAAMAATSPAVNGNRYEGVDQPDQAAGAIAPEAEAEGEGKEGKTRRRKKKGGQNKEQDGLKIFD